MNLMLVGRPFSTDLNIMSRRALFSFKILQKPRAICKVSFSSVWSRRILLLLFKVNLNSTEQRRKSRRRIWLLRTCSASSTWRPGWPTWPAGSCTRCRVSGPDDKSSKLKTAGHLRLPSVNLSFSFGLKTTDDIRKCVRVVLSKWLVSWLSTSQRESSQSSWFRFNKFKCA